MRHIPAWPLLCGIAVAAPALAAGTHAARIGNGLARVDLSGDGAPGMVVSAHRENHNAHGFEAVTFYVQAAGVWQIVPFQADGLFRQLTFDTSEGAGCRLRDARLFPATPGHPARLLVANRAIGRSYADAAPVRFTTWELVHDTGGVPGTPDYYFRAAGSRMARHGYCDVGEAFRAEGGD